MNIYTLQSLKPYPSYAVHMGLNVAVAPNHEMDGMNGK